MAAFFKMCTGADAMVCRTYETMERDDSDSELAEDCDDGNWATERIRRRLIWGWCPNCSDPISATTVRQWIITMITSIYTTAYSTNVMMISTALLNGHDYSTFLLRQYPLKARDPINLTLIVV